MKIILNAKRHHYLARVSIFLITLALIVGMVGCGGGGGESYTLTITSTAGGSVTDPGEGTFTYEEGTVVPLVAEAAEDYLFVNWTGDVSTIADVNAPSTNVTVYDSYSITANFYNPEIRDWYDLDDVRDNFAGNYTLMNDLDSTTAGYTELASPTANGGNGWQPIGGVWAKPFTGTFDGQKYQIEDLFINRPIEGGVGLFGSVGEGGVIENVGMVNVDVTGYYKFVGGLVGYNEGAVSNSYSTGRLTGNDYIGGLVGYNEGTVSNSYSSGNVTGNDSIGGLMGYNEGTVSNSYSTGSLTGNDFIGGLVGANLFGTVSNSYSTGSLTGNDFIGGLVGVHEGIVSNSYYNYDEVLINGENIITIGALFSGDFEQWLANDKFLDVNERLSQENGYYVINNITDFKELLAFGQDNSLKFRLKNDIDLATEPNFYIPYLAGEFDGDGYTISNLSFSFGFVSGVGLFGYLASSGGVHKLDVENVNITGSCYVGGMVGMNDGTVSNSYSSGNVTGEDIVGGLVGYNFFGTVSNSYSSGNLTGNDSIGGLVGYNDNGGTVSNSYSSGNVTGKDVVGGLMGYNVGTVSNSYSSGNVTGEDVVGGLMGYNGGTVSNSYSAGSVTGVGSVGGLVGKGKTSDVTNSFWDTETSGQATSDGGMGKTTEEMQNTATFSMAGWCIIAVALNETNPTYIWNIVNNVTYPFLSWEP